MPAHSKTILCPVDFSRLSADALREAALLARCGETRIVALHADWFEAPAYFTPAHIAQLEDELREARSQAQGMLAEFVGSTLGDEGAGIETRVVESLPADAIRETAVSTGAEMVVMGTHGRSGLNRWMLGSVAERVLRESPIPVLTVRGATERPLRHILCPVSDSEGSRRALAKAAELAACFEATVTALHVQEAHGRKTIPNLCAWIPAAARARCEIRELVRQGNAAEEIVRVAAEEDYDLIVLGAARRRFFEGLVLGTTTIRVVRHAPCPVLCVPETVFPPVE